ncbi:MAG: glycerol kinase GlpK [Propionibacteriaceae bacterium]|nr:glycerol kinase GlpK [Propionibacteriaceae bacterium]
MDGYILAIDQGTTSSRAIVFDHQGSVMSIGQREHTQIMPRPGWVEHDPMEIINNVRQVVAQALAEARLNAQSILAIGVTNQRETTVVWNRRTGEPVCNAIVWQDTRTDELVNEFAGDEGLDRYKLQVGLPLATYFAGPRIAWILRNVPGAQAAAEAGDLLFGTMDTWVVWNLTGGTRGGIHITDVTNASRTMLMNLNTLQWDGQIAEDMGIPLAMLPQIRSSAEVYGVCANTELLAGVPIAGILGDQQAAMFGQACFTPGAAKNTYGTGCFLLMNTGETPVFSKHGLLTTVGYQVGHTKPTYALEGSIAVTGSLVQWLRDNLGLINSADEVEELAECVEDNGGAYFVPAFSGLFAPYWRPDARGAIVGLTRFVNKAHLARAVLEATAYQTREVVDAMEADSGVHLIELKVDGGMVANDLLMQFQADQLGAPVIRPVVAETTALGAAYAAGITIGYWDGQQDVADNWAEAIRWEPRVTLAERDRLFRNWKKAVTRTLDWVDEDT